MTTETYLDLTYERGKGAKRPPRPKLLKLTDVSIPHRSRKKSKVKTKDRSATLVRERIYDDPAYTEDISHLANPIRRGSVPENHSAEQKSKCDIPGQTASSRSLLSKHQLPKELHQYVSAKQSKYKGVPSGSTAANVNYDCGSSSSDNETMEPAKASSMTRRVRSLERSLATERSDKKGPQKRNSKQKRNLSLDNSRYLHPGHPQHSALVSKPSHDFEDQAPSRKKYNESSVEAVQTEASEVDDVETAADAAAKVAIGKRFLRGEIGIKSFNYYLLKEGLKSSKKIVTKQRNTLYSGEPDAKSEKIATRSEENIYEEIFFKDTLGTVTTSITELATSSAPPQPPDKEAHNHLQQVQKGGPKVPPHVMSGPSEGSAVGVFADCEICMEQCSKDNCEYCLAHAVQGVGKRHSQQPKQTYQQEPLINQAYHNENNDPLCSSSRVGLPAAHILEFQSYNPNNPGVYKIETTPVAITGDYNPILQFQQSSATTSTSTTTTPSDQQQPQQQQQQHIQPHQLQKPIYGGYYHPQSHQKPYHTTIVGKPLTSQYAIGGSLLLAPVAGSAAAQGSVPPRRPQQQQQQQYIVSYQNGGSVAGGASLQLLNTKSSSSSDSLTQHKYNTITRLEANVFAAPNTGDLYYAVGGTAPLHPLMYAASRPIGGSQILVDPYDPPQMYKSDSKASILSEFSLRSSDNSQRYVRYGPHRRHGGGRVSDSSLFSIYSNSGQRRYFGSSESRLGYDCRRCSLDGIIGMGSGTAMGATTVPPDKCSYSDNCRYECRNCDCSSNYFSSDFDDMYGSIARGGSSGIPRKTAAGTLPSSFQDNSTDLKEKSKTPPSLLQQQFSAPLDLKQNKYAQDFFKHVNDVKRSIYQSEMQRNNSLESSRRGPRAGGNNTNSRSSPKRAVSQEPTEPVVTTLPLSRGRPAAGVRPTPAPRTSLQSQPVLPATFIPRDPTPTKRRSQPSGRREFPSLDRLVASNTGTIPKRHSRTMAGSESQSPKFTSKPKGFDAKDSWTGSNVEEQFTPGKRHHRTSSTKSHQNVPGPVTRRKDIPAPPPPSPATYSDLQELKANMEGLQDDTKSRSLESETSESPAVPSPSVRSLTGSHNEKKTRELAEAPLKISIALTDMNIPAEFCSTVSVLGHPAIGPDIGLVEQEDNDVFYDARSEDSGAGSLPTEVCLPQSKGAFGLVACSQEAAGGKGSQETIYSERENSTKDVNTLPHTDPIAEGSEPDTPQGNDIDIASDDAKSKKQGRSTVEEQITPHDVEKLVGMDTCLQTESEITEATLRGKHEEESSKARDDEKTQTSAIEQHAAATCLEEKQTSLPATPTVHGVSNAGNINSNDAPASTSVSGNATDVDVDVDFQFSCNTDSNVYVTYLPVVNTDSAALTHSDRTVDIPVLVTTAGIPAQSRTLTRQDYACLDSSEAQSDDSHLTRDSVTRESQNDELSSSTLEKLDVSTLPLPALPKRRRPRSRTSPSKNLQHRQRHEAIENANANETSPASSRQQHLKPRQRVDTPEKQKSEISQTLNPAPQKQHLSAFQQYVAKRRESLEASNRSFNEKLEARRMHYQLGGGNAANVTTGANSGVPTYLFGDHFQALGGGGPSSGRKSLSPATNKEEIYLNKSGWVQVNTKREGFKEDSCSGYRRQQNDSTACVLQDNGRSRAAGRVIPMDAQGHRTDLAHYSFIYQHQQLKSNVGIAEPKFVGSKVEELIQRNEARLGGFSSRDPALRPGYRIIDPQMASILNERPGFLPVKSPNDLDSPITPILSPPPAFQDNSRTTHQVERPLPLPVLQSEARQSPQHMANGSVKGMVFSRSFEYDTRRPTPTNSYVQTFSRSFDGHLSELPLHLGMPPLAGQRERSPNFSTLTGNSPNYLTKRESGGGSSGSLRSRDSSPKLLSPQTTTAYLNASVKEAPPAYSMSCGGAATIGTQAKYSPRSRHERSSERSKIHALGRSRKSQFNRMGSAGPPAAPPSSLGMGASRFRSFDTTKSQRLNSCDSGARSDLSNDELDNEDGGLSEFLSAGNQKFPKPCSSIVSISPFKMQRQRSLTPDRNESHSSSSSLRKQRSLTPESRSLTPEERRKKGSQLSLLGSRQSSGSRNNTLEARQRNGEKTSPNISRSSSSSSYSGGDSHDCLNASTTSIVAGGLPCPIPGSGPTNHRRAIAAAQSAAKQAEQEHRIRRSRSLQLSERSPNRVHKSIVNVSAVSAHQPQQQPKQPPAPSYQQPRLGVRAVFPPTVRTPPAANKIPAPLSASTRNTTRPRKNEADKARSFDFDYNNFNRSAGSKAKSPRSIHTGGSGGDSGGNQNQRIERESRSFDEEYREAVLNNNNGSSGSISGVRYLQPAADSGLVPTGSSSTSRLRQSSSPVNGSGVEYTASRSPKSSGSSSNNLHQPTRKTGSPQSYGTRLCDHELTFEMLRKSPIMNFRRGESSDFEPPVLLRNRETINSGGNSELNFMSNETRIYEHPTTVLKPQRSLRQSSGSRDDLPLEVAVGVGGDYIYRPAPTQPRSSRY